MAARIGKANPRLGKNSVKSSPIFPLIDDVDQGRPGGCTINGEAQPEATKRHSMR